MFALLRAQYKEIIISISFIYLKFKIKESKVFLCLTVGEESRRALGFVHQSATSFHESLGMT